ncbi:lysophospholipase L1-like esterase [Filimonas zeae]|uniref:Rhamnogalacturonan acetylesterase n=1 Tax=Filimonas zeae TaxID=1737353 RepID=A0A917MZJ8_9BACT|nr:rhamnogalacturonan acetylesterase [Filimonas zeae]MDR6341429.1 lysophospholipase L1-like esterase [Filimonas zeae]GGH75915.1 rhamnogalacturonan acetylesterase [Filimonas zeae]
MTQLKRLSLTSAVWLIGLSLYAQQQTENNYRFSFGPGKPAAGYRKVADTDIYSEEKGYGYDLGTTPAPRKPFYFSVTVPEGNYNVTLTLGSTTDSAFTTVKAESRRLLLENVVTRPNGFTAKSFTLNVRRPEIAGGTRVSLKTRELTKLDWDRKLTFEFNGPAPAVRAITITPNPTAVTVFLAGNSTVVDQDEEPWASWGQMIPRFFKPGVAIANHAESGLTLGSFLGSKRLEKVLSVMKKGDYLFIEFGHNDQKDKGVNDGAFKSYTERLKLFIRETKAKGGIPVVVTSTSRRRFDSSTRKTINTLGDFPEAARRVAMEEKVALIDLNVMTTALYDALGVEPSKKAFVHYPANTWPGQDKVLEDNTHFNAYGAYELAKCIVEGIKQNKLGISKYLLNDTPAFNPAKPDSADTWYLPASPRSNAIKPDGN